VFRSGFAAAQHTQFSAFTYPKYLAKQIGIKPLNADADKISGRMLNKTGAEGVVSTSTKGPMARMHVLYQSKN
jgi:hypothetical protein